MHAGARVNARACAHTQMAADKSAAGCGGSPAARVPRLAPRVLQQAGTPMSPVILVRAPRVPVPTGTHGESPAMAGRTSLTAHENTSLLTKGYSPDLCTAVLRASLTEPDRSGSAPRSDRLQTHAGPAHDRVQIGYKPHHPTPPNVDQHHPMFPQATGRVGHYGPGQRCPSGATSASAARPKQTDALAGRADLRDGRHKRPA
jgi:hypothetical protein